MKELINTIQSEDCISVLSRLPDETIDLVVTSPPYNIGKEYESIRSMEQYLEEQTVVLRECARVLKRTGSLFWQVGFSGSVPLDVRFFPILEGLGLLPKNRIVWIHPHGFSATRKFSVRHETILWFVKTEDYTFNLDSIRVPQKCANKRQFRGPHKGELSCNPAGKNPADIWCFLSVKHHHEEKTEHPCQFPEGMIARIILATTNEGGIVLDPYMGSGTVAVVAQEHGRRFVGAETCEKYREIAIRRLSGEPDSNRRFANLKGLRDYCERTGERAADYRFDVQPEGSSATGRHTSKALSEDEHVKELDRRLTFEENAFTDRVREK